MGKVLSFAEYVRRDPLQNSLEAIRSEVLGVDTDHCASAVTLALRDQAVYVQSEEDPRVKIQELLSTAVEMMRSLPEDERRLSWIIEDCAEMLMQRKD